MRILLLILCVFLLLSPAFAEKKKHEHKAGEAHVEGSEDKSGKSVENHSEKEHEEHAEGEKGHDDHGKEEHGEHDEEEHEENSQVGPGKGIIAASPEDGFQLSPEAEKNFGITRTKLAASGTSEIPAKAIVYAVSEVNIFRFRMGFYKRIDFVRVSRTKDNVTIRSKDLKAGDEIVTTGLGFLRIAEIAAFGGAPEGHSH